MKVFITSQNPVLDSAVDKRFGRCPWLILFDDETNQWEALENPGSSQSGGAGIAAAQFVVDKKADVVISGDFGPNASSALKAANIEMLIFSDTTVSVQDALDQYQKKQLKKFC